jgi:hypothetical protein
MHIILFLFSSKIVVAMVMEMLNILPNRSCDSFITIQVRFMKLGEWVGGNIEIMHINFTLQPKMW